LARSRRCLAVEEGEYRNLYTPEPIGAQRGAKAPGEVRILTDKKVHVKLSRDGTLTISEVMEKIRELQEKHPELDVFLDGDEYAICSIPKRKR
jgi:hypothetical protein